MLQGKVQSALRYISRNSNGGVLKLDDLIPVTTKEGESIQQTTREILKKKHPIGKDPVASSLIDGEPETVNPITFDGLDADAIRHAALHTHGAACPSGLDAYAWRRLCSSFKSASSFKSVWNGQQDAFFYVRVFYPNASSYRSQNLASVYRRHEQANVVFSRL